MAGLVWEGLSEEVRDSPGLFTPSPCILARKGLVTLVTGAPSPHRPVVRSNTWAPCLEHPRSSRSELPRDQLFPPFEIENWGRGRTCIPFIFCFPVSLPSPQPLKAWHTVGAQLCKHL